MHSTKVFFGSVVPAGDSPSGDDSPPAGGAAPAMSRATTHRRLAWRSAHRRRSPPPNECAQRIIPHPVKPRGPLASRPAGWRRFLARCRRSDRGDSTPISSFRVAKSTARAGSAAGRIARGIRGSRGARYRVDRADERVERGTHGGSRRWRAADGTPPAAGTVDGGGGSPRSPRRGTARVLPQPARSAGRAAQGRSTRCSTTRLRNTLPRLVWVD